MSELAMVASIGWKVIDRFHVGSQFAISPHGLGIAAGFLAGAYLFTYEASKRGYPEESYNSILMALLVGTIVGSRLGYVFTHLADFNHPIDILKVYQGGLSQLGGVVGAILFGYVVIRRRGLPFMKGLDAAAIPIPLGVIIGRIGDLIIGDHLGKPTSWALAARYHGGQLSGYTCELGRCFTSLSKGLSQTITTTDATLTDAQGRVLGHGVGVHQTALYDLLLTMGLLLLLIWLNRRERRVGILFFTYIVWYGSGRILTDFLRVENRFFGLTGSQWTSTVAVALGVLTLTWFAVQSRRPVLSDVSPP